MQSIKIYVINLPAATERRQLIQANLEQYGLEFEFVEAVFGKALPPEERARLNPKGNLTPGQIGCYLSHMRCYERMLAQGQTQAIVLEDDTFVTEAFARFVKQLELAPPCDVLFLLADDKGAEGDVFQFKDTRRVDGGLVTYELTSGPYSTNAYWVSSDWARCRLQCKSPFSHPIDFYGHLRTQPVLRGASTSVCVLNEAAVVNSMISEHWSPMRRRLQQSAAFYWLRDLIKMRAIRKVVRKQQLQSQLRRPLIAFASGFRVGH